MTQSEIVIRKTPFLFPKRVAALTGNSSQPLPVSKATKYMQTRFGG
ncbi:MAG TPA: hypothetical protein VL334_14025 [Anaerolineae bacterium]|nr:hypothetical protein [Anaerolineae bacterium]